MQVVLGGCKYVRMMIPSQMTIPSLQNACVIHTWALGPDVTGVMAAGNLHLPLVPYPVRESPGSPNQQCSFRCGEAHAVVVLCRPCAIRAPPTHVDQMERLGGTPNSLCQHFMVVYR